MEEHAKRFLVHAGVMWDVATFQRRVGPDADHDAGQLQGGNALWIQLQCSWLYRQEADSLHCLNVNQRPLLPSINAGSYYCLKLLSSSKIISAENRSPIGVLLYFHFELQYSYSLIQFLPMFLFTQLSIQLDVKQIAPQREIVMCECIVICFGGFFWVTIWFEHFTTQFKALPLRCQYSKSIYIYL